MTNPSSVSARARVERYPGAHAAADPARVAVIHAASGWQQTYRELDDQANRLSTYLRDSGLSVGDHVLIVMENDPRFVEIIWGCHYAGLVYTPCSTRLTADEISYIAEDSGAMAIITTSKYGEIAAEVARRVPSVQVRLGVGEALPEGFLRYDEQVDARPADALPGRRIAGLDMMYSSGTTGRPKGIARRIPGLDVETAPVGTSYVAQKLFGFTSDTVYLCPAPLYHGAGIRFVLACTALGGTAVVMDRFDPEDFISYVDRYAVTHTQVVPTMMLRMLRLPAEVRDSYDMSSLRMFIHSAAPCPPSVKRDTIDWLGPVVVEYYAGTESNGVVLCTSEEWLAHPGTVGRPVGCEIHVCDDDGRELPVGETGTVYFGGGPQFEYHGDPTKTAGSRHDRGWSTLGDIGHVDDDGFLYLTDRKAFMIISGGVNIYPQEAENRLVTHEAVYDAAVFGIPHEDFGEQVKAIVQPTTMPSSEHEREVLESQLIAHCREALADVKCPRSIDFVADLPRDPSGKLLKQKIRSAYLAGQTAAPR